MKINPNRYVLLDDWLAKAAIIGQNVETEKQIARLRIRRATRIGLQKKREAAK